jgi:DNA (cytosine-5)-methyltransferase 1
VMEKEQPTSLELFTGAGGLALGVAKAGFKHLALVELNRNAVASLNANRRNVAEMSCWPENLVPTNVNDFDFRPYRDQVTLLAAGAPCQPFSLGGKHRGDTDERNLFPAVFRAVKVLRPQAVIIENVKGLLRRSFREYFEYIKLHLAFPTLEPQEDEDWRDHKSRLESVADADEFRGLRYVVQHQLVNAANFGLPQRRERVFIVAFRSDLGLQWDVDDLKATHSEDALLYEQYVSGVYWRQHGMKPPKVPEKLRVRVQRLAELRREQIKTARWQTVRDAISSLPPASIKVDHPTVTNHVLNPGAKQYAGHTGSPLDLPAKTLKAGDHGVPGGENMLVADDGTVRYFTVREAARLQGFPDEYVFQGAWGEGFRQLGNAVPVRLAQVVAERVRWKLDSVGSTTASASPALRKRSAGSSKLSLLTV